MAQIQAVAAAGPIEIAAGVGRIEAIVGGVVEAAQGERGTEMIGLGGVVEHHVEHDFHPGPVHGIDHGAELGGRVGHGVARVGCHEGIGVVAPVVAQAEPDQPQLVQERPDRHQLDRGDPQACQVVQNGRLREPEIGPAQSLGHGRMQPRQPAEVGLVEDRFPPRDAGTAARFGRRRSNHALGYQGRIVARVESQRCCRVDQVRAFPAECARDRLGIGVQQQAVRVEAVAALGRPRPMRTQAVDLTCGQAGDEAVEHAVRALRQLQTVGLTGPSPSSRQSSIRSAWAEYTATLAPVGLGRHPERERAAWTDRVRHRSIMNAPRPLASSLQVVANVAACRSRSRFFCTLPMALRGRSSAT